MGNRTNPFYAYEGTDEIKHRTITSSPSRLHSHLGDSNCGQNRNVWHCRLLIFVQQVLCVAILWSYIKWLLGVQGFLIHTSLWRNLHYKELLKLRGFGNWERAGIRYISQMYNGPNLKSFLQIQAEFDIPRTNFYCTNTCSCGMPYRCNQGEYHLDWPTTH